MSLTISPIRDGNSVRGLASIAQDITERRAAEKELRAARETALESSRLKSEFLATMSHEIRTPMNGVVGLTALLLETPLDETQQQYAQGVKGAGEALLALINDILDFSKLEAGKVDLDVRPFDPRLLVEEVAGLLAEPAQAKELELIAYCEPGGSGAAGGRRGPDPPDPPEPCLQRGEIHCRRGGRHPGEGGAACAPGVRWSASKSVTRASALIRPTISGFLSHFPRRTPQPPGATGGPGWGWRSAAG